MSTTPDTQSTVLIGGAGHLGERIAALLRERGYAASILTLAVDDDARGRLEELGCRIVLGDLRSDRLLEEAGIDVARCCLFVSSDERANLEAAITARDRNLGANVVLRAFSDMTLARHIEGALDVRVLNVSELAAPHFVAAAFADVSDPGCVVGHALLTLERETSNGAVPITVNGKDVRLDAGSVSCYARLMSHADAEKRRVRPRKRRRCPFGALNALLRNASPVTRGLLVGFTAVMLVSILVFSLFGGMSPLDAVYFVVTTVTTTGYGDFNLRDASAWLKVFGIFMMIAGAGLLATLYALIADYVLTSRVEALLGRKAVAWTGHTVIVGLGNLGFRVAQALTALGVSVAAVEANEESDNVSAARTRFPVIIGSAARDSVLEKASLAHADAVLALTDDPMLNLSVALHAREANPALRAVVRTYETSLADRFAHLGLFKAISTSALAAPVFVDAALHPGICGALAFDGREILVVRQRVAEDSPFRGHTPAEIGAECGVAVAFTARDGIFSSSGNAPLRAGDDVLILLTRERLSVLHPSTITA